MTFRIQVGRLSVVGLILLELALSCWQCDASNSPPTIQAVCTDDHRADLRKRSEVRGLAEQIDTASADQSCPARVLEAITELHELVNLSNDDVCLPKKVNKIRAFYQKFIDDQSLKESQSEPLPKLLRSFFLAYGLRVSSVCKKNMINSLMWDAESILEEADFNKIGLWTDESSIIAQMLGKPSDYDDLILPKDLIRLIADEQEQRKQSAGSDKMLIQTATSRVVHKIQSLCAARFRPIYSRLILPLVQLSNMGFNYQGEELERELKEMKDNKRIHQWYRIVYLCETISSVDIVEDANDRERTEGTDRSLVRIMTREEFDELAEEGKVNKTALVSSEAPASAADQVVYEPGYGVQLEDEIVVLGDRNLVKLIGNFQSHKNELDRIRSKFLRKVGNFIKESLKRGNIHVIGSMLFHKSNSASDGSGSSNDELVKQIDQFVASSSKEYQGASPVAGVLQRAYHQASYHGVSGLSAKAAGSLSLQSFQKHFWTFIAVLVFILGFSVLFTG